MTISELATKYQNTGIDNNPVISTPELLEYHLKLEEFMCFIKIHPNIVFSIYSEINSVDNMIWARKNK